MIDSHFSMFCYYQAKSRKRLRLDSSQYCSSWKNLEDASSTSEAVHKHFIRPDVTLLKSDLTNAHHRKMLGRLMDEQNRLVSL